MPANLRTRVQEFDPFRRITPSQPVNVDTYAQPTVDTDALNRSLSLLESVKGLSGSVNRFLDRGYAAMQEQVAADAQAAIADLTPDQIRAASERDWETISRERGVDNPWWKIRLDEAAGRRTSVELAENLVKRGMEASNPDDPNAHLRVIEEERNRATEGMNSFQRAAFDQQAESITTRFLLTSAEERESRTQTRIQQAFRDDVRGLVRDSLDPALGGAVDLGRLRAVIESERIRSGNDGRAELFAALQDSITVAAAQADSDAELDALRLQATAMLTEVGSETFGGDHPLEDVSAAEMDKLEALAEQEIRQREDFLRTKANKKQSDAYKEMDDYTLGLAAQVFDGSIDQGEATAQMLAHAQEKAAEYGVDPSALTGRGRLGLSEQSDAMQQTRFARASDPDAVKGLDALAGGEDFDSGWFGVALSGAVAEGKLSREDYARFLEIGTNGVVRATQKAASSVVAGAAGNFGERLLQAAEPMLDSIPDPALRDQAKALLLADADAIMASERGRLEGMIGAVGIERVAEAEDKWQADFLTRSSALIGDAVKDAQDRAGSWMDPQIAFRNRVQAAPIYKPSKEKWTRDYAAQALAGDEDTLFALGNAQVGALPIEDAAALIASGRYPPDVARAAQIDEEAEEAFLVFLGEKAALGKVSVGESILSAETILRAGNYQVPPPPKPAEAPAPDAEQVAATAFAKKASTEVRDLVLGQEKLKEIEAEIAAMEANGEHPATIEIERKNLTQRAQALEREKVSVYEQRIGSINRAMNALTREVEGTGGKRTPVVRGLRTPNLLIEVRDGHFYPVGRGSVRGAIQLEEDFIEAKIWTGLTLQEVKEGKALLFGIGDRYAPNPNPEKIVIDRKLIQPNVVPFFKSVSELESADLTEWLALFPGYTPEAFRAAQRQVIAERIPAQTASTPR